MSVWVPGGQGRDGEGTVGLNVCDDVEVATHDGIWREGILGTREATADLLVGFGRENDR